MVETRYDERLASLRGGACLLLVAYHVIGADPSSGLRVTDSAVRDINDALGYLRMPIFALLAGLFQGRHSPIASITEHLADKAHRLLLPMLVVGTLFAVVQAAVPEANASVADWRTLHLVPVAHYWFLWAIFWNFALCALLDRLGAYRSQTSAFATLALAGVASIALPGTPWLALDGALYLLPYFTLGLVVGRHHPQSAGRPVGWGIAFSVAALAWLVISGVPSAGDNRRMLSVLMPGLLSCLGCLVLWPKSVVLARIGRSSYAVFLYHVFFTAGVRIVMGDRIVIDAWAVGLLAFLAGVTGPILLETMLKRHRWTAAAGLGQRGARVTL
jgi:peptidoglycan/LPS O-acetylase OafA/YrhL